MCRDGQRQPLYQGTRLTIDRRRHWTSVYTTKGERDVSWFEVSPAVSVELIEAAGLTSDTCIIDVGGGDSRLVDALLERGVTCIGVLDIAATALQRAQARLGDKAAGVAWIHTDVTNVWSWKDVDVWHDRAVFHFLADPVDRRNYKNRVLEMVKPGGSVIIATFALEGPEKCSGLPVTRYSPETLTAEFGNALTLVESRPHLHITPWGTTQTFQYSRFRKT